MARRANKTTASDRALATSEWLKLRRLVLARDGHRCWRCGKHAETVDHILPRYHGGSEDMSNLAACCGHCNYSRKSKYYDIPVQTIDW